MVSSFQSRQTDSLEGLGEKGGGNDGERGERAEAWRGKGERERLAAFAPGKKSSFTDIKQTSSNALRGGDRPKKREKA